MDALLRQFNGDVHTKDALIEYIHLFIADEGIRRIYANEDVSGVRDAKKLIDGAFEALHEQYAIPNKPKENTTEAR